MTLEFYTPEAKVFKSVTYFKDGSVWSSIENLDDNQVNIIFEQLRDNKAAAISLHRLQQRGITSKREKIRRFIRCNWGSLDQVPDLSDDGSLNFEHVECDCRATCKDCGVICIKNK